MEENYRLQNMDEKSNNDNNINGIGQPSDYSTNSEENKSFPPKPKDETQRQSLNRSLISIVLFVVIFYLIFKWDIVYILVLAGVILIHEIGHYLAMRIFKYKDLSIFFVPLIGAFASGNKDTISQKQRVFILLSGPVPGIIIGLILYYYGLRDTNEFLSKTSNIFILINLFNLLPIIPLDGGRLIQNMFFDSNEVINKIFIFLSIAVLTYFSISTKSYFLLIIPFLLLMQLNSLAQRKKVKDAITKKGIDINKSFENLTNEEYWSIRDEIAINISYYNKFISPKVYSISDKENQIIKLVKTFVQKKPIKDLKVGGKILITLFWILTFIIPGIVIAIYYIKLGLVK